MYIKQLVIELCNNLEKELNSRGEFDYKRTVEFFSGMNPSNYFLPMMHIGTTKTIPINEMNAWFVEISVDNKCIFRESAIPSDTESLEVIENYLIQRALRNIFTFGIMTTKDYIDKNTVK